MNRTTDAFRLEANGGVGMLAYAIPLPVQEHFRMHVEADLLTQNSGLVVVQTARKDVAKALMLSVETLNDLSAFDPLAIANGTANQTANGSIPLGQAVIESVLTTLDGALANAGEHDKTLRIEALGLLTQVPEGGFYGAHVFVATLSWQTVDGAPREAKLTDWFHVVGDDGESRHRPVYGMEVVLQDPFGE